MWPIGYRMAPLPLTISDLLGHLCCLKLFCLREIQRVLSSIYLCMNRKVQVACNFNYLLEKEKLLRDTASHVYTQYTVNVIICWK